jgi:hypothetical protein
MERLHRPQSVKHERSKIHLQTGRELQLIRASSSLSWSCLECTHASNYVLVLDLSGRAGPGRRVNPDSQAVAF